MDGASSAPLRWLNIRRVDAQNEEGITRTARPLLNWASAYADHFDMGRLDITHAQHVKCGVKRLVQGSRDGPRNPPKLVDLLGVTSPETKLDIFTAGTDPNAATIVWAMTKLVKNPNSMKKARQEVRNKAGNRGAIDENDLQQYGYLQAVIKETMRLHPLAPLLVPHETTQKCNISGYEIRPKTVVHVNAWAIGRDPESWENPEVFSPERFIGSSIDFRGRDFELIPFGAGRRGCPGLHMGVAVVEFALANLLYWFNWEFPDGMKREDIDTDVKPGITMHKKNPLCLVPRKWSGN
ncbi:hypothetical protein Vadar_024111 [Vaccinium darrowii]|uniref:Uncharacterized protein n=1 Tax=Vaccinium darrowii TaxID=229202 RepID=A0ACB7XC44_9ERIC|nr:hypothetical protein Vadar_024111 [Vaccinium darrowii]